MGRVPTPTPTPAPASHVPRVALSGRDGAEEGVTGAPLRGPVSVGNRGVWTPSFPSLGGRCPSVPSHSTRVSRSHCVPVQTSRL